MDDDQQFCLRWNNHQSTLISVFDTLLENGTLVDCTLAAEGKFLKAHKVVLSACSPYFATLLSQQYDKHPIFILKDVKFQELRAMMDYMYRGEVNISQDQLAALLKAAESLQIKGLSDSRSAGGNSGLGIGGGQKSSVSDHKPLSVPVASGPLKGNSQSYTIEQKRPRHTIGGPSSIDSQCGSREGSSSPTSRKRKKLRRRSMDNINADNHEHSNSSSQSMQINSTVPPSNTSTAITSVVSGVAATQAIVAAAGGVVAGISGAGGTIGGAGTGLSVTKKTDSVSSNAKLESATEHDMDNENGDEHDENTTASGKPVNVSRKEQNKRKQHVQDTDGGKDISGSGGEMLIEPKSEYDDGNDETVEDLTLDDEELLEDLEQAGPSHGGGEGSSQGYAQWQVDRSQDDVFMAAQEAAGQQRDPQDLRTKPKPEPPSPAKSISSYIQQHQHSFSSHALVPNLSGMLLEFYQKNSLNVPKNNKIHNFLASTSPPPYNKTSNTNCETELNLSSKPSSVPSLNSSSSLANKNSHEAANDDDSLPRGENLTISAANNVATKKLSAPFHPRIKYSSVNNKSTTSTAVPSTSASSLSVNSLPSSVIPASVIQPPLIPPAPTAAAIAAAAFFREEYRLQQLQAQEFLSHQQPHPPATIPPAPPKNPPFYIPPYLKNTNNNEHNNSEVDDQSQSEDEDNDENDDDDDSKYPSIEDIHLIEGSKSGFHNQSMPATESDYLSDESHKYSMIAAQALRNLEYSLSDYGGNGTEEQLYNCRHCGKKYRWKSTLRRHENVECGGKEPSHQCPYCPYKSKQRGNLGVHVRKHHANLPQLISKRRSKYSQPRD